MSVKVGDTVIIEGIVSSVHSGGAFCFVTEGLRQPTLHPINPLRIKKIIPAPWVPKVGDTVFCTGCSPDGVTLIHIHKTDKREFAVVAYEGNFPMSMLLRDLRATF